MLPVDEAITGLIFFLISGIVSLHDTSWDRAQSPNYGKHDDRLQVTLFAVSIVRLSLVSGI